MQNKIEELPIEVKPLEDFLLYIKFQNEEEFKKVKVYGITLKWSTGEDIAPEKIYFNSIPIKEFKSEIKKMK